MKVKQQLFCLSNRRYQGQIIFVIVSMVLILFVFFVIILGNITTSSFQFTYTFRNFISLRSLLISGLRYALYQINKDPNFATDSAQILMPQGYFNYSVFNIDSNLRKISVQASLNNFYLTKTLMATATISNDGYITDLEISEQ